MKTLGAISLVLGLATTPAQSQDSEKWLVMGRDVASIARSAFAENLLLENREKPFAVFEANEDRIVARAKDTAMNVVGSVIHQNSPRCGGYTVHDSREEALAEVNNPFYAANVTLKVSFPKTIDQRTYVLSALDMVSKNKIMDTIEVLSDLGTRFYTRRDGQEAAIILEQRWKAYGLGRSDFSVKRFPHDNWKQDSVIATIPGSTYPEEIVLIGAHLDSINPSNNFDAPGADDDAAGLAVVSETLRVLLALNFRPQRTLQFMAYAAEEVGLMGSEEIAESYMTDGKKVLAVLQMDMTGFAGSTKDMYFIADKEYVNGDLTDYLKKLLETYNQSGIHKITYGYTKCGYACSDHVSWTRVGVPSAFPFESTFDGFNKAIHSSKDVIGKIDTTGTHQARFAKLALEYMIEIGESGN